MKQLKKTPLIGSRLFLLFLALFCLPAAASADTTLDNVVGFSDPTVGSWDPLTQTGTLTTDVTGPIYILSDDIILDGAGFMVSGDFTSSPGGIIVEGRSGVTVKNLHVDGFPMGIYLWNGSTGNYVSGCSVTNSQYGLSLENNCTDNILTNNYVALCTVTGIYLASGSNGNTIFFNTSTQNYYGIRIYDAGSAADFNYIYNNNFIDNTTQTSVSSGGNMFYLGLPVGGNYWSNWAPPAVTDSDGDGILDGAYVFTKGPDLYPWAIPDGWLNDPPVADAGPDQSVHLTDVVTLDGSGSSDFDENYPLTYAWEIISKPGPSTAVLSDATSVNPSFTADVLGDYLLQLVVTDDLGAESLADTMIVSSFNTAPMADAGMDQLVILVGTTVQLDGTGSFDEDGDGFTYAWTLTMKPAGSLAELSDATSAEPTFVPDMYGTYFISLVTTDVFNVVSDPDEVVVTFSNVAPVADAGMTQSVIEGDAVVLDGTESNDENGDGLTYSWSFVSLPEGSAAVLTDAEQSQATFVADVEGSYVLSLVVNDGLVDSDADNVTVTAITVQDAVTLTLRDAAQAVNSLPRSEFKNRRLKRWLAVKINVTRWMVNRGWNVWALAKLKNDIRRKIDGWVKTGTPENNDWITTVSGQQLVYPFIAEAINLLENATP